MQTISQRELRNNNAEIMRGVEAGERYRVTRRGVPVAVLEPIPAVDLACLRPARIRSRFAELPRVTADQPTGELLDELRADR